MVCDQAKEVGPAIMDKMVGQEIKRSHSNALLKLLPWPRTRSSGKIKNSSNIRRWRWAANIIDKDHGI